MRQLLAGLSRIIALSPDDIARFDRERKGQRGFRAVTLKLRLAGLKAEVYVADSQIRYLAPLYDDLVAEAVFAEGQAWDLFVDTLVQRGRARIQVDARVLLPEGGLATTLSGRYVAIAKR